MDTAPPPLTAHRRHRILHWLRVWLTMIVRLLPVGGGLGPFAGWMAPILAGHVRAARAATLLLIFIAAAEQTSPRANARRFGPGFARPSSAMRQVIGVQLRRFTRGRDLRTQIENLLALLCTVPIAIARLARRLRRGLKRRVKIALVRTLRVRYAAPINAIAVPNSS